MKKIKTYTAAGLLEVIDYSIMGFDKLNPQHFKGTQPLISVSDADANGVTNTYVSCPNAADFNKTFYDTNVAPYPVEKDKYHKIVSLTVLEGGEVKAEFKTVDGKVIFDKDISVYRDTKLGELLYSYDLALQGKENGRKATQEQKDELAKFNGGDSLADVLRDKILEIANTDNIIFD